MNRLILPALLSLAFAANATGATYEIDARHTQVLFTYSHGGYSNLVGRFMEVEGSFDFDAADPTRSTIDVRLPLSSLSTGVAKLDAHLLNEDFFDAGKFPTASFKSGKVTDLGGGKLSVAGDLTLHGTTRPVLFEVTINKAGQHPGSGAGKVGLDATTTIKRSEFGVSRMVPMIPDEVKLSISMEAQEPKKADAGTETPAKAR